MKSAIGEDFSKWIIDQNALSRKAASDRGILSGSDGIKQVFQFRKQVLKITIHCQHILAAVFDSRQAITYRASNALGRSAKNGVYARIKALQLIDYATCAVSAVIINQD